MVARDAALLLVRIGAELDERENPACLNSSRKRRIALGCGQKVEDINRLLKQFDQMQQLMKQMNGKGKKRKLPGKMGGFPGFPGM